MIAAIFTRLRASFRFLGLKGDIMRILALSSIVLMFACSAPLPALLSDDSPELRTKQPWDWWALGSCSRTEGQPAELNQLVVGEAIVRYRLLDNRQQPFENRGVTVEVVAEGFDRLADFPRGGTCTTDAAGECAVVFKLLAHRHIANLRALPVAVRWFWRPPLVWSLHWQSRWCV